VLSTFAALKARNYCLYWFGLVFYVLGHRAEYVTFAWMTWEVTWIALPMLALVGFSNTFYLTQVSTFIQQGVPDHLRGRVLSLYSLCWNLLPLGGLVSGVLAAAVDARFAILFGGAMVAMNALVLLTSRRLRAIG
jgi:uncharacterized membrane protein